MAFASFTVRGEVVMVASGLLWTLEGNDVGFKLGGARRGGGRVAMPGRIFTKEGIKIDPR